MTGKEYQAAPQWLRDSYRYWLKKNGASYDLQRYEPGCVLCFDETAKVNTQGICGDCLNAIKRKQTKAIKNLRKKS